MRKASFLMLFLVFITGAVFAASKIGTMGAPNSTGTYPVEAFDDRSVVVASDASLSLTGTTALSGTSTFSGSALFSVESATTNDTLTTSECGKTFLVDPSAIVTFNLPTATAGCGFRFTAVNGSSAKKVVLNPDNANIFRGLVNSAAVTTLALGDSVISPGNTADSIYVFSAGNTIWDIVDIRGTWVDNN